MIVTLLDHLIDLMSDYNKKERQWKQSAPHSNYMMNEIQFQYYDNSDSLIIVIIICVPKSMI